MLHRILPSVLVFSLTIPVPAFANLRESIDRHAASAAEQAAAPTRNDNPYKMPALILTAGGAGLLVLGLIQDRGAEVSTNRTGTAVNVQEKGGSKTALTVLGVIAMGSGVGLWAVGETKRSAQFGIWGSPASVGVRGSVGF